MTQRVHNFLRNQHFVTYGAVLALGQTGFGTGGSHGLIDDFRMGMGRSYPRTILIGIRALFFALHIVTVSILQLGGGQGDFGITGILNQLIGNGLGAGIDDCLTGAGGIDIGTAGSGIDITLGGIHSTVHANGSIHKVRIGTGIGSAGGINDRCKLLVGTGVSKIAPLVCIIDIDIAAVSQRAGCAGGNIDFGARQECHILIDGNGTAVDIDSDIAVDGQLIILGVDRAGTNGHIDGGQGQVAVGFHHQTVPAAVIALDNVAVCQIEHGIAASNKANRRAKVRTGHINGGIGIFLGAGIEGQGDLNILDVILGQGEYAVFHFGTLGAATEVRNLEHLVNAGTGVGGDRAGAGDETIGIQGTAIIDGDVAAALHLHHTHRAGGSTAIRLTARSILLLGRDAHGAVDSQVGTVCQSQGTVGSGCFIGTGIDHLCGIHGIGAVKGYQQSNALGNGVITGGQGTAVHQNDGLAAGIGSSIGSLIQIIENMASTYRIIVNLAQTKQAGADRLLHRAAQHEVGSRVGTNEHSLDGHIRSRGQGIGSCSRQNLTGCPINPAMEGCPTVGSCHQRNAFRQADFLRDTGGHSTSSCSDAAEAAVILEGDIGGSGSSNQADVFHGQRNRQIGEAAVGCNYNLYIFTGSQQLGIGARSSCTGTGYCETACFVNRIVKRKCCSILSVIGNGNGIGLLGEQGTLRGGSNGRATHRNAAGAIRKGNISHINRLVKSDAAVDGHDHIAEIAEQGIGFHQRLLLRLGQGHEGHVLFQDQNLELGIHDSHIVHFRHNSGNLFRGGSGSAEVSGQDGINPALNFLNQSGFLFGHSLFRLSFLSLSGLGFFGCRSFGIAVAADGAGILNTALHLSGLIAVTGGIGFIGSVAVATCAGKGCIALVGASRCSHGFGIAVLVSGLRCLCLFGDGGDGFFHMFMVVGLGFRGEGLGRHHGKKHDHCHHKRQKPPGVICKHCIPS